MDDGLVTKYKNITGVKQPSAESLERILRLKEQLGITDDDGLWSIFITLDMYVRLIETFNAKIDTTFADALVKYRDKGGAIKNIVERDEDKHFSIANLMVIFGIVFALCLVSFFAGAMLSGSSPPWITETRASSAGAFIMQLPGGWIFFVMAAVPAMIVLAMTVGKFRSDTARLTERMSRYVPIVLITSMVVYLGMFVMFQMFY